MKKLLVIFNKEKSWYEVTFGDSDSDAFTLYFEDVGEALRYLGFALLQLRFDEEQRGMD